MIGEEEWVKREHLYPNVDLDGLKSGLYGGFRWGGSGKEVPYVHHSTGDLALDTVDTGGTNYFVRGPSGKPFLIEV